MPYVKRNTAGSIVAVFSEQIEDGLEQVETDDADLEHFLLHEVSENDPDRALVRSDLELARVLEDLIDVLINKNVIAFTDLPAAAQTKLLRRHGLRSEFSYVQSLFSDGEAGNDDDVEIEIDEDIVLTDTL